MHLIVQSERAKWKWETTLTYGLIASLQQRDFLRIDKSHCVFEVKITFAIVIEAGHPELQHSYKNSWTTSYNRDF